MMRCALIPTTDLATAACQWPPRPKWVIDLEGDQLREHGLDVCHWFLCSAQATSRAEQGTDFSESFMRRLMRGKEKRPRGQAWTLASRSFRAPA